MPRILHCLLLICITAYPAGATAHDSSFTGLGTVPSGMGLGTAPGGKLDRKQDLSASRAERGDGKTSGDFHHRKKPGSDFDGAGIRFRPHQIFIIQDPEARHRARRYGESGFTDPRETAHDFGFPRSFDQVRGDFAASHSFEEIRSEFGGNIE